MLSRWIMTEADVFLLEEPTRGIDVGAKTEVYEAIGDCVKNQKGVVVVSSEEEEVLRYLRSGHCYEKWLYRRNLKRKSGNHRRNQTLRSVMNKYAVYNDVEGEKKDG